VGWIFYCDDKIVHLWWYHKHRTRAKHWIVKFHITYINCSELQKEYSSILYSTIFYLTILHSIKEDSYDLKFDGLPFSANNIMIFRCRQTQVLKMTTPKIWVINVKYSLNQFTNLKINLINILKKILHWTLLHPSLFIRTTNKTTYTKKGSLSIKFIWNAWYSKYIRTLLYIYL